MRAAAMRLSSIHVYPVKGARGVALDRAEITRRGLAHDRRFMVVGDDGGFFTQRSHPRLALVDVTLADDHIVLGAGELRVPLAPEGPRRRVRVWRDDLDAVDVGPEAAAFFSDRLGAPAALVYMPDDVERPIEPAHARAGDHVSFADGFPLLLAAQASLDDLSARIRATGGDPVPMVRFRPNLVVAGGEAFAEEEHDLARVGSAVFRMPKRCSRCTVTLVDPETATLGKEPLRTLATYRAADHEVYFGMNLVPEIVPGDGAEIAVGDAVTYARA